MDYGPVTMRDIGALQTIVEAAQGNRRVKRLLEDIDLIVEGTARSIGDERGYFLGRDEDVRSGFLRVTTTTGMETFWPVTDLMIDANRGYFVLDN